MAGSIVQYTSGETSFVDGDANDVSTLISDAREDKLDFILLQAKGKDIWVDPLNVEAVFAVEG